MKPISAALLLFLSFGFFPAAGFGQGTLRGTVLDSVTNEPLLGANVFVPGTALGGVTDREGVYRLVGLPEGRVKLKFSYIGYKSREIEITFTAGAATPLNIRLAPDVIEGTEVVVTGQRKGQMAAINQQLTSQTIMNVISEEKIKELPDANAAEAIGRLPGVSILRSGGEANKVILRGMSDKFTTFTIDGIRIPSTDRGCARSGSQHILARLTRRRGTLQSSDARQRRGCHCRKRESCDPESPLNTSDPAGCQRRVQPAE